MPESKKNYRLTQGLTVMPELVGTEASAMPFAGEVSAQRSGMESSNIAQFLVCEGAELPLIMTGYESFFGDYEFNASKRSQDVMIVAVIPKFTSLGMHPIKSTPKYTVIAVGIDDNVVTHFDIDKYYFGSGEFGYRAKIMNENMLTPNMYIPKDVEFVSSPIKDGSVYKMGVNAQVAFMTIEESEEDAFLISDELANKCTTTGTRTITISLRKTDIPLNLYGDADFFKFFPDIGETVREDGILCGFRRASSTTYSADLTMEALEIPQQIHDELYFAEPGAEVVDVNIWIKPSEIKKPDAPKKMYEQAIRYEIEYSRYCKEIINIYKKLKADGLNFDNKMNSLVSRAISYLGATGREKRFSSLKFYDNKAPVEFVTIEIKMIFERKLTNGGKLTGRDGGKGTICKIIEKKHMPTDDYGFTADIILNPGAVPNRLNPSQWYEQEINRMSEFIRRRIKEMPVEQAFDYLIEYIRDIRPPYADILCDLKDQPGYKAELINTFVENGIILCIQSFAGITLEKVLNLYDKYQIPYSPVTFDLMDDEGNVIRSKVRTKEPVMIGSKYLFLLGKIPTSKSVGVGHVDQFRMPFKPKSHTKLKHKSPISLSPIRIGEDEGRNLIMATRYGEVVARMYGMYGNSPQILDEIQYLLLTTEHPSAIQKFNIDTQTIVDSNVRVNILKHCFSCIGLDLSREALHSADEYFSKMFAGE